MVGRHQGFDPILVTSFAVSIEPHDLRIPKGEAAFLIGFEGSDFLANQPLAKYIDENLASSFYEPSGMSKLINDKEYIELKGQDGSIWITSQGNNIYSVFVYSQSAPEKIDSLWTIVSSLAFLQNTSIPIPTNALGRKATPSTSIPIPSYEPAQLTVIPEMKLPWDVNVGTVGYTGGPHSGAYDNTCSGVRDIEGMNALDFGLNLQTEILAAAAGTVTYANDDGGITGKVVTVDHGNGFFTSYIHLYSIESSIQPGVTVGRGTLVGQSGTAGSGPHLHLQFSNWPETVSHSAHGMKIDGYTARTYVRTSDNKGFNYWGTLTRGQETEHTETWAQCNVEIKWWSGSEGTIDDQIDVRSTNVRCPASASGAAVLYRDPNFQCDLGGEGLGYVSIPVPISSPPPIIPDSNGFCGQPRNPPIEAETRRFCNQLS